MKTRAIPSLVTSLLSYFLQRIGVYRSANIIRQEIVQYLSENPNNSEGQPLQYFAGLPWSRYLSECDGGKETKSPFNNDDTDDMLNDDDAVDPDDPFSYDDAIDAGSLFSNDGTVNNNDAVDGSDMFNNDDAVGTNDLFSNDDAVDFSVKVDEQPRELAYEIWEQILSHVISQSDFLWPDHKCRLFCRIRSVNCQFYQIMESLKLTLTRVYLSDERVLNQKSGKRAVSVQRLIKRFGSYSGVILELKRINDSSKWNRAWVVLLPDVHSWFIVTNIFWRKRWIDLVVCSYWTF